MATKRDYYDVLGVQKDADADAIKKAYRKLAMQHHPDRAPMAEKPEYEARFKECAEAYEVLSDEAKRERYDSFNHAGAGSIGGMNMADIFGMPHWNSGNVPRQGADIGAVVDVELNELLAEHRKTVRIKTDNECSDCNGRGLKPGTSKTTCKECKGARVVNHYGMQGNVRVQIQQGCGRCMATGTVIAPENKCPNCTGGKTPVEKEVEIVIPAGMSPEYTLRVPGIGRMGVNGGPRGELHVRVNLKPHSRFKRVPNNPNDLLLELPVSFVQSCLGDQLNVEMIDGSVMEVSVPAHSQNGHTVLLEGQGIPSLQRKQRGYLWVRFNIEVPTSLTSEQTELLKKFEEIERGKNVHKDNPGTISAEGSEPDQKDQND